jgi:peptide-methionine (R)-S-oxide reductase
MKHGLFLLMVPVLICMSCNAQKSSDHQKDLAPTFVNEQGETIQRIKLSEDEWAKNLSQQEFDVLRKEGTERAFTGRYWDHHVQGVYTCAGCGLSLFDSDTKFESGTGWPSFYEPLDSTHVGEERDVTFGMVRTEVHCNRCGGHLGHVFNDGPAPTGLRYCINSVSLGFIQDKK